MVTYRHNIKSHSIHKTQYGDKESYEAKVGLLGSRYNLATNNDVILAQADTHFYHDEFTECRRLTQGYVMMVRDDEDAVDEGDDEDEG